MNLFKSMRKIMELLQEIKDMPQTVSEAINPRWSAWRNLSTMGTSWLATKSARRQIGCCVICPNRVPFSFGTSQNTETNSIGTPFGYPVRVYFNGTAGYFKCFK